MSSESTLQKPSSKSLPMPKWDSSAESEARHVSERGYNPERRAPRRTAGTGGAARLPSRLRVILLKRPLAVLHQDH
jgi:hypothetical protein